VTTDLAADLAIPPGGCLVHIGFDKTGTTSLQSAFHTGREQLRELGVVYPGTERYQKSASIAVTQARGNIGGDAVTMGDWRTLVREVGAVRNDRVMVSSEWLCRASDKQARKVVRRLGGKRVHVVATLRPLSKILPAAWQQYVKDGFTGDYESWLRGMLLEPPYSAPTPWFWLRHRHDAVLARWTALVGPENVTAIVVDTKNPDQLLRQFESLLALPHDTLARPTGRRDSSLTWPEAELLRQVNIAFREQGLSDELYADAVRGGILPKLADARASLPVRTPIRTPHWALERAAEVSAAAAATIEASGIRVLGDLASLGRAPQPAAADEAITEPPIEVATASQAIVGILATTQPDRPAPQERHRRWHRTRPISSLAEF
jgi:hypothetical protein